MVELVRAGLATAHSQRVVAGGSGRTMEVAHVRSPSARSR
jgi:membrane carboxypeptidase/penicillin-binding protein PbpC